MRFAGLKTILDPLQAWVVENFATIVFVANRLLAPRFSMPLITLL